MTTHFDDANTKPSDFYIGERVEAHPATDAWMMGDRYGDVLRITATRVHVSMDSKRTIRFLRMRQIRRAIEHQHVAGRFQFLDGFPRALNQQHIACAKPD